MDSAPPRGAAGRPAEAPIGLGVLCQDPRQSRDLVARLAGQPGLGLLYVEADLVDARRATVQQRPEAIVVVARSPDGVGLCFLRELRRNWPTPVVILNAGGTHAAAVAQEAYRAGAREVMDYPGAADGADRLADAVMAALWPTLRTGPAPAPKWESPQVRRVGAQNVPVKPLPQGVAVIAIGASTGGLRAIGSVLEHLPPEGPPVVVAQHIKPGYIGRGAARMNDYYPHDVALAHNGEILRHNQVRFAPDGHHLVISASPGGPRVDWREPAPADHFVPSANVLIASAAAAYEACAVAVVLTGMGRDGTDGAVQLRTMGGRCIGEAEASCVVYGMPKAAKEAGGIDLELPAKEIGAYLGALVATSNRAAGLSARTGLAS